MEYLRWAKNLVSEALSVRRVVVIFGARQAGKTTLTKQVLSKDITYRTLDDTNMVLIAKESPADFLKHDKKTMIIDEIQKVPELISEIKIVVDNNNRYGQFILTGSADVFSLPQVTESLAGRVKNIRLRTLTEGEIHGTKPNFIEKILKRNFQSKIERYDKKTILEMAIRGGYPEVVFLPQKSRKDWYRDYLNTLIDRDLKNIANIRRADVLNKLISTLAAWSAKYINTDEICSCLEISKNTLKEYISLLEHLYLFERVPAWTKTDYDKVGKKDKIYISDTGLMTSILNWHYNEIELNSDRCGKLIETMIFKELATLVDLNSEYSLYQYRDSKKREIDFIIETENNEIIAIEVKSGSRIMSDDFKHIKWFRDNLIKNKKFTGIVLYTGQTILSFGKDLFCVPMALLWS